ncbi:septum formation initiator family protein [Buchnera aphidicola]|uniref:Cell division protein FtsB n=1 Tax=Buchnera aphidicola (Artemisaphis artemisicola) TaxID=1241836 RepID=A0A4D6XLH7_9GAMM|nr:septum formation initiator family protein [Buchnera aphidicola]QCI16084.1 cell division protein FtsB [Buchnera aphidicola (Artemisaphis artemisicola)]
MKTLKMFLLCLLIWLQYSLWFGKNGILDYIKIYKKVKIQKKNNDDLDIRNNQIMKDIENLNNHIQSNKQYDDTNKSF